MPARHAPDEPDGEEDPSGGELLREAHRRTLVCGLVAKEEGLDPREGRYPSMLEVHEHVEEQVSRAARIHEYSSGDVEGLLIVPGKVFAGHETPGAKGIHEGPVLSDNCSNRWKDTTNGTVNGEYELYVEVKSDESKYVVK